MLPVLALIGRPNVGKSTLFNQMTRSRSALVMDSPGVTRDRQYGEGKLGNRPFIVIDTGGLTEQDNPMDMLTYEQTWTAIREADVLIFIVDAQAGLMPLDRELVQTLRALKPSKPILLCVNKTDGRDVEVVSLDFYALGLGQAIAISAAHNRGVAALAEYALDQIPEREDELATLPEKSVAIAIVGRPNVGKSTLLNRILGEDRVVVFDQPGTTRDSIFVPFERDGQHYTLIDTAGVRRRAKVTDTLEKFSVIKTLQAIGAAHVVVLVLDAHQGLNDQDKSLLSFAIDAGKGCVIALNKWDGLDFDSRAKLKAEMEYKLTFASFATRHFISALHGTNVGHLYGSILSAYRSAMKPLATSILTRILQQAVIKHPPPMIRGRRIKLRYAHAGGHNPPIIVIHGNQTASVPESYGRYLIGVFQTQLKLTGTPVRLQFRTSHNPYTDKPGAKATPLQKHKARVNKRGE